MSYDSRCKNCRDGRLCLKHSVGIVGVSLNPGERPPAMPDTCARCGQTHPRCAAHNKAGKPCGVQPRSGQKVCRLHGGSSPQALAEANRRQVEQAAEVELRKRWKIYGDQPVTDPLTELARVAGEVVAFKDYLRDQVTALDGVLTYWQQKEYLDGDGDVEWTKAAEEVRAIVAAYERAQDRAAKILAAIVKLDIADRMLSLRTRQADAIVDAVRTGLATIDLPTEIRQGAEAAVADALEQITLHDPTPKELTP